MKTFTTLVYNLNFLLRPDTTQFYNFTWKTGILLEGSPFMYCQWETKSSIQQLDLF